MSTPWRPKTARVEPKSANRWTPPSQPGRERWVSALKLMRRRKAIVIPKLHGKYVVVRHRNKNNPTKKGDITFIGGGCEFGKNIRNCARNELYEESRTAINPNNFNLREIQSIPGNRAKEGFLKNNLAKGIKVNMTYHIFEGTPKKTPINFHTIKKRFNTVNISNLPRGFHETTNIMLISKRDLMRMPEELKYFLINYILKVNHGRNSVNGRLKSPRFS